MNLNQASPALSMIDRGPSVGGNLGAATGVGISQGLQMLLERKMQGMQQQKLAEGLMALGLPPEAALLDPSLQKELLSQKGNERKQARLMDLIQRRGVADGERTGSLEIAAEGPAGSPGYSPEELLAISEIDPNAARLLQSSSQADRKLEFEKQKQNQRSKEAAYNITKDYRAGVAKTAHASKGVKARTARMRELDAKGNITKSALYQGLRYLGKPFGFDPIGLLNADTQELEKLSNDFIKDAPAIFSGSKLTNEMVKIFLKSVPTLVQSAEGRERVYRNMETMADVAQLEETAVNEIIAENGGAPPLNLDALVQERIQDRVEELMMSFAAGEDSQSPNRQPEIGIDEVIMIDPAGNTRKVKKSDAKRAKAAGYKLG